MFNSPHLVYCNCASAPLLYCPSVHSMWNCSIPNPSSVYRASLDAMATHSGPSAQEENTEAISASRNLKFGIENILYGSLQSGRSLSKMQNVPSLLNSSVCCIFLISLTQRENINRPRCSSTQFWGREPLDYCCIDDLFGAVNGYFTGYPHLIFSLLL